MEEGLPGWSADAGQAQRVAPAGGDQVAQPVEGRIGEGGIALEEVDGVAPRLRDHLGRRPVH